MLDIFQSGGGVVITSLCFFYPFPLCEWHWHALKIVWHEAGITLGQR
jgi:hypothetical protein